MILSVIISIATCVSLMLVILLKPSLNFKGKGFDIYWIVPVTGAVLLLICGAIGFKNVADGFTSASASNPIKVLILFFSVSLISVYLDETGFFEYLAVLAVKKARASQVRLFFIFFATVSVLTVFTSNDIVILTFTPFICKFTKRAKINPTPYIVAEFVGANTWSMLLIIGNPTNVYLASVSGIGFMEYLSVMAVPTVMGSLSALAVMFLIFRKFLVHPICVSAEEAVIAKKTPSAIGLFFLSLSTVFLAISGYINVEMWLIALIFAGALVVSDIVYTLVKRSKPTILFNTLRRLPWQLAPTVIGMFTVVLALVHCGATEKICTFLGNSGVIVKYGVLSTLMSNVMNNIPMSVLFSQICSGLSGETAVKAVYSTVIGSNLGALFTPVGALAGIMFTKLLTRHGVEFRFIDFIKYGSVITVVALTASLSGLAISMAIL